MLSLSLREISSVLHAKKIFPSELCSACLERAEAIKSLNAFITLTEEHARREANEADQRFKQGKAKGPLDGIPIAFKDNYCTKGVRTTCASYTLKNYVPTYNATVVEKAFKSGAVLIGKTNLDEFAMGCGTTDSIYGPVKNVWRSGLNYHLKCSERHEQSDSTNDATTSGISTNEMKHNELDHQREMIIEKDSYTTAALEKSWFIPGGSSGGSAVAVASGSCFVALGSDTGGSTRLPASYTGLVGLKPTYGLVSRRGLIPLVNSMDTPSVLTRTVDDAALTLNLLAGHDPLDSTTVEEPYSKITLPSTPSLKGIHIGIPREYHCPGMSPEVIEAWTEVADLMEKAGANVTQVSLPHTQYSIACYSVLNQCEVASNMARYDGIEFGYREEWKASTEDLFAATRHKGFNEVVRGRILCGNYFLLKRCYNEYFLRALKVRRLISQDFLNIWKKGVNVLLTPVTLTDAPEYDKFILKDNREQSALQDFCTQPVNMAGLPAISIPVKLSSQSLPLSLQLIGQSFQEKMMLSIAKWLENTVNFPKLELVFK